VNDNNDKYDTRDEGPATEGPVADFERDMSLRRALALSRCDFERALTLMADRGTLAKRIFWWLLPQVQAVFWYRISRWLYLTGWRSSAQIVHLACVYLTSAELPPVASIGPGCILGHAAGTRLVGRFGERLTVYADVCVGGGIGEGDIGGGDGLPVVGDDVTIGAKAMVLGAVRVGNGARIGPAAVVTRDVPAGATVFIAPPRMMTAGAPAVHSAPVASPMPASAPHSAEVPAETEIGLDRVA